MGPDNADSKAARTPGGRSRSTAVIRLEVIGDDLGIGIADRSPECLDHLGDLRVPQGRVGKRRVHHDVIEAVATGAVAFDLIEARRLLELNPFFLGTRRKRDGGGGEGDDQSAHGELPQATSKVTLCTTLWW